MIVLRRGPLERTAAKTEDWGNSIDDFFAQTFFHTVVIDAELLRPCSCSYHPRCRAPRIAHSKVLTSGQRRSPRRRSQHLAAVTLGLACLRARSCALVRPSDEKSESATGAARVLSAGTAALTRHGIAIWYRVPRAGVVRNDVVSLLAPSRATGSATVRNPASSSDMPKSPTFARRKSPRGWFERRLAVGSRLSRLGATACAL